MKNQVIDKETSGIRYYLRPRQVIWVGGSSIKQDEEKGHSTKLRTKRTSIDLPKGTKCNTFNHTTIYLVPCCNQIPIQRHSNDIIC
ncbi:hypothetical protein BRADI_3g16145v3 [Brachypodium distachyon]|uniref:Uncharacterized protein n=1 Tax=Brachypodium distachyon TaxID=15368 RepID=A0A0Q3I3V8_BRADI|nr:hypothetical protein BRADI_3g16145v3 [Brachypodium distachyon]